jgi:hypothetical protein
MCLATLDNPVESLIVDIAGTERSAYPNWHLTVVARQNTHRTLEKKTVQSESKDSRST